MEQNEIQYIYQLFTQSKGVSIDTRTIEKGQLFFAISGENFDGNQFAQQAVEKGAIGAIVSDNSLEGDEFVCVNDTLEALQQIARHHRLTFTYPIIGLTGSNGKTTTKELLVSMLSVSLHGKATKGNLNNHIGVPLTLLSFTNDQDYGIVEMGANHVGEIDSYCQIALPDIGVITNIGKAHIGEFGGLQNIIQGKTELFEDVSKRKGLIIFNEDETHLSHWIERKVKKVVVSQLISEQAEMQALQFTPTISGKIISNNHSINFLSHLGGEYNYKNIRLAAAISIHLEISIDNIALGIQNYEPKNNRSQWIQTKSNEIFLDAYNANPSSMYESINHFMSVDKPNKVLIIGDMNELGEFSDEEHSKLIQFVESLDQLHEVYLVGPKLSELNKNAFKTNNLVKEQLVKTPIEGSTILIKGSRSLQLETLVNYL